MMVILASTAIAVLLVAGTAWGDDASPGDGQISEVPLAGTEARVTFVPNEVVLKTKTGSYEERTVAATGLDAVKAVAARIEAENPSIEEAGPNYLYTPEFVPDDPLYSDHQYWLRGGTVGTSERVGIRASRAWDQSRGGNVAVGYVDTGWDRDHPDLVNEVVAEWDFLDDDNTAGDNWYHGTSVGGIIGADTNNGKGVASAGFNVGLNVAKACTEQACSTADTALAIAWLAQRGVGIINLSFGAFFPEGASDPVLEAAVADAQVAGALLTASSGDIGQAASNHFPSCYAGVVGVGSTNRAGSISSFSTRGPCVDLVAPGEAIATTFNPAEDPYTKYARVYGTSFSAPQVAGAAALVKAHEGGLTATQLSRRLFDTATDLGPVGQDETYGYGLLNANCAVSPDETGC
jgi:subtilisin family serine protease